MRHEVVLSSGPFCLEQPSLTLRHSSFLSSVLSRESYVIMNDAWALFSFVLLVVVFASVLKITAFSNKLKVNMAELSTITAWTLIHTLTTSWEEIMRTVDTKCHQNPISCFKPFFVYLVWFKWWYIRYLSVQCTLSQWMWWTQSKRAWHYKAKLYFGMQEKVYSSIRYS